MFRTKPFRAEHNIKTKAVLRRLRGGWLAWPRPEQPEIKADGYMSGSYADAITHENAYVYRHGQAGV